MEVDQIRLGVNHETATPYRRMLLHSNENSPWGLPPYGGQVCSPHRARKLCWREGQLLVGPRRSAVAGSTCWVFSVGLTITGRHDLLLRKEREENWDRDGAGTNKKSVEMMAETSFV
jgi:hypothetical protein